MAEPATGPATIPATAPAVTPAGETTRLVIGGKPFDVPTDLVSALRSDRDRLAGEYGSRLQNYEARIAELEAGPAEPTAVTGPRPPDPRDLELNPEKFARENQDWTQHLIASSIGHVEAERQERDRISAAETARAAAWSRQVSKFYEDNPKLRGDEDIVDAVWRKNFSALQNLSVDDGFKELARLSHARLVQVSERGRATRQPARLESAAPSRNPRQTPVEEEAPAHGGLGAAIRAKAARFRMPSTTPKTSEA